MKYDVIIIGGGPSGLMAAVAAGRSGSKVLLLDKGDKLGRKLAISGGGRCNVTNAGSIDFIIKNIPGNGRFLHSAFSVFNNKDIIEFFEGLGIPLKEEDRGRMFPVTDKAKDVVNTLINQIKLLKVEILTNAPVDKVLYEDHEVKGIRLKDGKLLEARSVVIAVGGKSVPHTGSTGDGYEWAQEAGHTITELYPTEVPLTSKAPFIQQRVLQGLSLRSIHLAVLDPLKHKKIIEHEGDIIFTHFGLSGPAALRCSQFVIKALKKHGVKEISVLIDLFPTKKADEIMEEIQRKTTEEPKKAIKNVLKGYLPERLIPLLLEWADIDESTTSAHLPKDGLEKLSRLCKEFPVPVNGTLSIEEAFVTGGGINLKEIEPKTMKSKIMPGLFFCGEILDIHGYTGGFNITAAFATGYTAGQGAAEYSRNEQELALFPVE
ncbi:NAD(P)/FAD-dependent oxidoreductase [Ammoniphilus sp. CFH 90114]|uniref:NAD(P)/FAD-dependent oxidoreductase n=1 Tax=Ammoniphilus sp. CFH 90114 TaxID=2493665 RepID=UPI00100DDDB6|nr:NAD(P)/FAD-dependent oxidoreductase [Ammoniphilus sp. CFH 90114]RXT05832.1 NAD(P)/FAD-dependent oxidoreductase [Ammoniphilus sp. CFH 90114]